MNQGITIWRAFSPGLGAGGSRSGIRSVRIMAVHQSADSTNRTPTLMRLNIKAIQLSARPVAARLHCIPFNHLFLISENETLGSFYAVVLGFGQIDVFLGCPFFGDILWRLCPEFGDRCKSASRRRPLWGRRKNPAHLRCTGLRLNRSPAEARTAGFTQHTDGDRAGRGISGGGFWRWWCLGGGCRGRGRQRRG